MAHNPLSNYLYSEHSSTLVCTSAGVIGGISKAIATPHLLNVTFSGGLTVASYAALSSIAAYLAKETLGWLHKKLVTCIAAWRQKGGSEGE